MDSGKGKRGLKSITLEGSPFEMGLLHGETFRDEIREIKETLRNYLSKVKRFLPGSLLLWIMERFSRGYRRFIPVEYMEEMRGVASGAGVEKDLIVLINVFDDLASRLACSAFAVLNRGADGAPLILARNLDYPVFTHLMCRLNTVFTYRPSKGHHFMSIAWPGYIGAVTGMNSRGICFASLAAPTTDKSLRGEPTGLLYRKALQHSSSLDRFVETITSAERTIGNNVIAASCEANGGEPGAVVIELSSKRHCVRGPENGILTVTNHYNTQAMKNISKGFKKPPAIDIPDKYFTIEYSRLREELLKRGCSRGGVDPLRAIEILRTEEVANPGTVQSVVFIPGRLEALVAERESTPVSPGTFKKFSLSPHK